jgi:hypothetical protein
MASLLKMQHDALSAGNFNRLICDFLGSSECPDLICWCDMYVVRFAQQADIAYPFTACLAILLQMQARLK